MLNWRSLLLSDNASIREAMELFEKNNEQIAIVITADNQLVGTITDGDIRRGLLKNVDLSGKVTEVMNQNPAALKAGEDDPPLVTNLRYVPVVSDEHRVIGVRSYKDVASTSTIENPVVIMAGGEGKRLRPLTEATPKPMLEVDGRPIAEKLLTQLTAQGFQNFYFSINYLGDVIEKHFGDGNKWGVKIDYLRETTQLGTGGSLSLLDTKKIDKDIVILNGDLVTDVRFKQLLEYHTQEQADVTLCIQKVSLMVPYGVVHYRAFNVTKVEEKPMLEYQINCGIYVIRPDLVHHIPQGEYFDMPMLIDKLIAMKKKVVAFPLYEDWHDIGNVEDLKRVRLLKNQ